jgi:hypothetical protein
MATHSKFIKSESLFKVEGGKLVESDSLGTNVAAKMNRSTGDLEAINADETYDALEPFGNHINDNGELWWNDPESQVFGTEKTGGITGWAIYKQSNIYTTARKFAGKDNKYGVHIFRYPNISSSSTWGGLRIYPPAEAKLRGHKYRFSFDYRGYTGGHTLDVYQSTEVGWSNLGIGLPSAWGNNIAAFDTDWEWKRYEYDFEIEDSKLDFVPGSNQQAWNSTANYTKGYYGVTYNGYVYRRNGGNDSGTYTIGQNPEDTYNTGDRTIWNGKYPMTAGYFDIYRQIKVGFTYQDQNSRGTHIYLDNIHLTDITTNQRWKYNGSGWEADNLAEKTTHIFAKGTALVGLDKGDGGDIFAVEGSRELQVNGTSISTPNSRGLTLVVIDEATGNIDSNTNYDIHGSTAARDNLATALSNIGSNKLWTLTSYDAIGTSPGNALSEQMKAMGSEMLITSNAVNDVSLQFDFGGNRTNTLTSTGGMYSAYNALEADWKGDVINAERLFFRPTDKGGYDLSQIYFDIRKNDTTITIDFIGANVAQTHTFQVDAFYKMYSGGSNTPVEYYIADVTRISGDGGDANVFNATQYEVAYVTVSVSTDVALEYSVYKDGSYRSPYAAVGRGQQIIKEDGSAQVDNVYKRKGVIDLRV